jgi:hypothetical protein
MSTPIVSLTLLLFPLHHLALPLKTLGLELFWTLLDAYFRLLEIRRKPGMCTIFAILAFWTETAEVERT